MSAPVSINLPAGRELDALIAERVMGWCLHEPETEVDWAGRDDRKFQAYINLAMARRWCRKCKSCVDDVLYAKQEGWRPSQDIAAAWEVVERCWTLFPDHERQFGLDHVAKLRDGDYWRATLRSGSGAEAETAPLAICRAALKAVDA